MNNEEFLWIAFLLGGTFFAGVAVSTFVLAIICTIECIRQQFSVIPIALYWSACGLLTSLITVYDWYFLFWTLAFASPVFLAFFWYYDKQAAKRNASDQITSEHDNSN